MPEEFPPVIVFGKDAPPPDSYQAYIRDARDSFHPSTEVRPTDEELAHFAHLTQAAQALGRFVDVTNMEGRLPPERHIHFFPDKLAMGQALREAGVRLLPPHSTDALSIPRLGVLVVRQAMPRMVAALAHELSHEKSITRVRVDHPAATEAETWRQAHIIKGNSWIEAGENPHATHIVDEMLIEVDSLSLLDAAGYAAAGTYPSLVAIAKGLMSKVPLQVGEAQNGLVREIIRGNLTGSSSGVQRLFGTLTREQRIELVRFNSQTADLERLNQLAVDLGVPFMRQQLRAIHEAHSRGGQLSVSILGDMRVPRLVREEPPSVGMRPSGQRAGELAGVGPQQLQRAMALVAEARALMQTAARQTDGGLQRLQAIGSSRPSMRAAVAALRERARPRLQSAYQQAATALRYIQRIYNDTQHK